MPIDIMPQIRQLTADVINILGSYDMQVDVQDQVQMDGMEHVYRAYPQVSARARASRRKQNGGVIARKNIFVSASGLDLEIEAKAPLQHAYSYWTGTNASDVVIEGRENFKQPFERNFLLTKELKKTVEQEIVFQLQSKGYDASLR